jgi:lysine 2,3-aminomutase
MLFDVCPFMSIAQVSICQIFSWGLRVRAVKSQEGIAAEGASSSGPSLAADHRQTWAWQLANRLLGEKGLRQIGWESPLQESEARQVIARYPWAVTPYYLSLARSDDHNDPVRRQFLPSLEELETTRTACPDPLNEIAHTVAPGLIQRYPDRAVLLVTGRCAVLCRHCFRKRLWGAPQGKPGAGAIEEALAYLHTHPGLREVILSGGDPLILEDAELDDLLGRLRSVPHLELIRIGTRMPVVLPFRITPALCRILERHTPVWVVTQFNHPHEITRDAEAACVRLLRAGVPVENQAVLLRGINDDPEIMKSLCQGLLRIRVRPYYLHQCDPVAGAEHFRTPLKRGLDIIRQLQGTISGLALPRFVVDLPGRGGKVTLEPNHVLKEEGGRVFLLGNDGNTYAYEDPP